jgi:hypothetical protein
MIISSSPPRIMIFDCGCVPSRPQEESCHSYGTRWRAYVTKGKILLKCRDCGRIRHFVVTSTSPVLIQYSAREESNDRED